MPYYFASLYSVYRHTAARKLYCVLIGFPFGTVHRDCCFVFQDYVGENSRFTTTRSDRGFTVTESSGWPWVLPPPFLSLMVFAVRSYRRQMRYKIVRTDAGLIPRGYNPGSTPPLTAHLSQHSGRSWLEALDVSQDCKRALSRVWPRLLVARGGCASHARFVNRGLTLFALGLSFLRIAWISG